jgi:hypothetical protein
MKVIKGVLKVRILIVPTPQAAITAIFPANISVKFDFIRLVRELQSQLCLLRFR